MPRRIQEAGQLGPILSVQVLPEVAARVRADAVADERPVSQFLRKIIMDHYQAKDAEQAA